MPDKTPGVEMVSYNSPCDYCINNDDLFSETCPCGTDYPGFIGIKIPSKEA